MICVTYICQQIYSAAVKDYLHLPAAFQAYHVFLTVLQLEIILSRSSGMRLMYRTHNYLKGIHMFKPTNYFYVKFHNINGLTKSSPVFADGFRVGIVRDLYYDYNEPGKVVAEIDVDPELRIPKGSTGSTSISATTFPGSL